MPPFLTWLLVLCSITSGHCNTPIPHRPRIPRIDTNWQIFGFVAESYSIREDLHWSAQSVVSSCNSEVYREFGSKVLNCSKLWPQITRFEKSCVIRTKILKAFLDIVTESQLIRRRFWAFFATLSSFLGNREIKPSNKTKKKIVEGFSLRLITPSRACEQS